MASPDHPEEFGTRTDPMVKKWEVPPKMVWVDKLEASIEKIMERSIGSMPHVEQSAHWVIQKHCQMAAQASQQVKCHPDQQDN